MKSLYVGLGMAAAVFLLALTGWFLLMVAGGTQGQQRRALAGWQSQSPPLVEGQPSRFAASVTSPGGVPTAVPSTPTMPVTPSASAATATRPATGERSPVSTPRSAAVSSATKDDEMLFEEMYSGGGARGLIISDKMRRLDGKRMEMTGFMAPPLKPALDFFVLTRVPLALCPFCSSDTSWPEDIVFVRMPAGQTVRPVSNPVRITGRLELGTKTDEATGFVSLVRIYAERVEVLH